MHHSSAAESPRSTIARQREQDRLVAEFVASLNGHDRAFAECAGIAKPLADRPTSGDEVSTSDDADSASQLSTLNYQPALYGVHNRRHSIQPRSHPILDELEPRDAVAIDELTPGQIAEAHDAFARGLGWVHEPDDLIQKAERLAALIVTAQPRLECDVSMDLPVSLRSEIVHRLDTDIHLLGIVFGRVFAWCREAQSLSSLGLRAAIVAYVIRPQLLDAATNARIGHPTNSTRQAINKLVGDFRDTFSGIRAPAMRGEVTRSTCRKSQIVNRKS